MAAPVWAGAAVGATECGTAGEATVTLGSVTLAALAIPGLLLSAPADAQPRSDEASVSVKLSHYADRQPGLERIRVTSPAVAAYLPLASDFSLEVTSTYDAVSGASPRWHSAVSGASRFTEHRTAGSGRLRHHADGWSLAGGVAGSSERDYRSLATSLDLTVDSEDRNRSWLLSLAHTRDEIHPVNRVVRSERRFTSDVLVGVTQNWTAEDVLQVLVRHSRGRGYFNDPYKIVDRRPRARDQSSILLRGNHTLGARADVLRWSWRFYDDSFGVRAHTVTLDWAMPLGAQWRVTPGLRYHTQRAADFYYDPVYSPTIGEPYPIDWPRRILSSDHRLSAFGALTASVRVDWQVSARWAVDLRIDRYEQRSSWRLGGKGSPGLAPLSALQVIAGASVRF
jgi:hypothetical protein